MRILAIDTSCDETAAAVTEYTKILSNVIWSQASLHAKFGGVLPSLAKRKHEERIDFVINKALQNAKCRLSDVDAVAVTIGPGLAIALEVGIRKAKELSKKSDKPFIAVNHIEGHILSSLAKSGVSNLQPQDKILNSPALGIVTSGGHTEIIRIKKIGKYEILAQTTDDALGEALDKAARMLGLGYPGGAILEKLAKEGNSKKYPLPIPLLGQEKRMIFSYSGLKTSFLRKIDEVTKKNNTLSPQDVKDLAASFQESAFSHFIRVLNYILGHIEFNVTDIYAGGGVMANALLRKRVRDVCKKHNLKIHFPYSKRFYGDNAAMIGLAAGFKYQKKEFITDLLKVQRIPNLKINDVP